MKLREQLTLGPVANRLPDRRRFSVLLLTLAAVCLFCGCAAEAPPRPPRIQTPQPVKDLRVTQVGRALILDFTTPRLATDGRRLTKPIGVELFRQVKPPGGLQPGPFVATKPWVSIKPQILGQFERGNRIRYTARMAPQQFSQSVGSVFSFRAVTLTRGFRGRPRESDPSNIASTRLLDVSAPVVGLQAKQTPHALELRWSTPNKSLTGAPISGLTGYRIYRALKSQPGILNLVGDVSSAADQDRRFQFGQTYVYKVRAVFTQDGYTAMTADSEPVEVTPREIFPPPPPTGLTAVYTGKAVELIWKPEIEPNLAGYNVYRLEPGKPAERLNPQLLRTPAFTDRAITQATRTIYWVTAVDGVQNESQPSARATVETQ